MNNNREHTMHTGTDNCPACAAEKQLFVDINMLVANSTLAPSQILDVLAKVLAIGSVVHAKPGQATEAATAICDVLRDYCNVHLSHANQPMIDTTRTNEMHELDRMMMLKPINKLPA